MAFTIQCPKCGGSGQYQGENPVENQYTGAARDCLSSRKTGLVSCGNHQRFKQEGHPFHGRTLVQLPPVDVYFARLRKCLGVHINGALEAKSRQKRGIFLNIVVPTVFSFGREVKILLGLDDGAVERAAAEDMTLEAYRELQAARNHWVHSLWNEAIVDDVEEGAPRPPNSLREIYDWFANRVPAFAPLWKELAEDASVRRYHANGQKAEDHRDWGAAVFGPAPTVAPSPAPDSSLSDAQKRTQLAARAVTGLRTFFASRDWQDHLSAAAAKVLEETLVAGNLHHNWEPAKLHEAMHTKGVGPKTRQVILSEAGVETHELDALGECL